MSDGELQFVQDKTWIQGPDNAWEYYTVLGDAPAMNCDVTAGTAEPIAVGAKASGDCC